MVKALALTSAAIGLVCGLIGGFFFAAPVGAVIGVGLLTGAAAGAVSGVTTKLCDMFASGKGPAAGVLGVIGLAISHFLLAPAAAIATFGSTINLASAVAYQYDRPDYSTGRKDDKEPASDKPPVLLTEEFKGACDNVRKQEGAYILPKGCKAAQIAKPGK